MKLYENLDLSLSKGHWLSLMRADNLKSKFYPALSSEDCEL